MPSRKVRLATLGLAVPALIALGAIVTSSGTSPRAAVAEGPVTEKDTKVEALVRERLTALKDLAAITRALYLSGRTSMSEAVEAGRAARNAELDLCDTDKERAAVLEKALAEAKETEEFAESKVAAARATRAESLRAKANRLEIEIALERVRAN